MTERCSVIGFRFRETRLLFFVERYWGYIFRPGGGSGEYRVQQGGKGSGLARRSRGPREGCAGRRCALVSGFSLHGDT